MTMAKTERERKGEGEGSRQLFRFRWKSAIAIFGPREPLFPALPALHRGIVQTVRVFRTLSSLSLRELGLSTLWEVPHGCALA